MNDIVEQIREAISEAGEIKPGFYHVEVLHDPGCPALKTQRLIDCQCKPIIRRKQVDA